MPLLIVGGKKSMEVAIAESKGPIKIKVDYSITIDPPLIKKFDQFNSGLAPLENYKRDAVYLKELNTKTLRIDLGLGGRSFIAYNAVEGTHNELVYDFTTLDELAEMLNRFEVLPYYSLCYVPLPLQENNDSRKINKSIPNWKEVWKEICKSFTEHFKRKGIRIGYYEIYNEPDLDIFFQEPFETYLDLYKYGASIIKQINPDVNVGGPALAFAESKANIITFLEFVDKENLPLDFFSFHEYWEASRFWSKLFNIRQVLSWYDRYKTTEIHLNEVNYVSGWQGERSILNHYEIVPKIFDLISEILKATDITTVNWAQFMESTAGDDAYGIIHRNGHKKAAYNAFKIYADMPERRALVDVENNEKIGVLASSDSHKACIVLWNRTNNDENINLKLDNIPFTKGSYKIYRIDRDHSSYFDGASEELKEVEAKIEISTRNFQWSGIIPANGTIYLTINDGYRRDFEYITNRDLFGKDIKVNYYFENRDRDSYEYFDRKTWKVYLGMGSNQIARSLVGITAEKLPSKLNLKFNIDGKPQAQSNRSSLYLRIDYEVNGEYVKSVAIHNGLYKAKDFPFGTKREPDEIVKTESLENLVIDISKYAPVGWDSNKDRIILSFEMCDVGPDTRAIISIEKL